MLQDEALLVMQRENQRIASEASLVQSAINGAMSKDGAKSFAKQLKALQMDVQPRTTQDLNLNNIIGEDHEDPDNLPTELAGADVLRKYGPRPTN